MGLLGKKGERSHHGLARSCSCYFEQVIDVQHVP